MDPDSPDDPMPKDLVTEILEPMLPPKTPKRNPDAPWGERGTTALDFREKALAKQGRVSIASIVRDYVDPRELVDALASVAMTGHFPNEGQSVGAKLRLEVIGELLDRGWGRPVSTIEVTGAEGGPVDVVQRSYKALSDEQLASIQAIVSSVKKPE